MKIHYILLSIEVPESGTNDEIGWSRFLGTTYNAKHPEGTQTLASNVWLIPRDTGMPFVAEYMEVARKNKLRSETRFLTEDVAEYPLKAPANK